MVADDFGWFEWWGKWRVEVVGDGGGGARRAIERQTTVMMEVDSFNLGFFFLFF